MYVAYFNTGIVLGEFMILGRAIVCVNFKKRVAAEVPPTLHPQQGLVLPWSPGYLNMLEC